MGESLDTMIDQSKTNKQLKQARHAKLFELNHAILKASGYKYETKPTALLFREGGKPSVDFYPHTGRWKDNSDKNRMHKGGAAKFLDWYIKRVDYSA